MNGHGTQALSLRGHILKPETFSADGVNIVTEKGVFDINADEDKSLLGKLAHRYNNQRVVLSYEGGDNGGYEIAADLWSYKDEDDQPIDGYEDFPRVV